MNRVYKQEELLELIDVNPPYFALQNVSLEDGVLSADVPVEQPLGNEAGPISAAEASRHLAILGVCSCALANPTKKRHYYLAYRGIYERVGDGAPNTSSAGLTAKASCISVDRKKGEAVTELFDSMGNAIIRLRVFYHVILDTTFERLYKEHYVEKPNFKMANPYSVTHKFRNLELFENAIECAMGAIPEYYCAGHFPHYPALPVAVLVYNLFYAANTLLNHVTGLSDSQNLIRNYEIAADNLAFSGDYVDLMVNYIKGEEDGPHELYAEGISNGEKSVGRIHLVMETCEKPVSKVPQKRVNNI